MATLVPTPSVEVARSGCAVALSAELEQAGEAAEAADHLGPPVRLATEAFISVDGVLAGLDVDPGGGVGDVTGRGPSRCGCVVRPARAAGAQGW